MPLNPGRELLGDKPSVGRDSCLPMQEDEVVELAVFIEDADEDDEVASGPQRPKVPKSREEREPMLKNCLLISLLLPETASPLFRSRPPRTLFSSFQIPVRVGS